MLSTAILNGVLALGVIVMVVAPLVWAILTQRRDNPRPAAVDGTGVRTPLGQDRPRAPRPQYKPVIRRA